MLSMFAVNFLKKGNYIGHLTGLCKISKNHNVIQVAFMKRLSVKKEIFKPEPYPYWDKKCSTLRLLGDPTLYRYDENTKLIVVDGLPAVGKTKLCEQLAEEFGLLYMPPPTHDQVYVSRSGYDFRDLDPQLPVGVQSCDLKRFLNNPFHPQVPCFQAYYMYMRFEQYMNALLHILATGQGVILNRSIYSDIAFSVAMQNAGYLNNDVVKQFRLMRKRALGLLLRPHLIIYLDSSPEVAQQNIKKRGNMDEINSKVFTTQYLLDIDKTYKEIQLNWLSSHTHILMYDWSKGGNYLDIVMDIEDLNLEEAYKTEMLSDWIFNDSNEICQYMAEYQAKRKMFHYATRLTHETVLCPELWCSPYDNEAYENVYKTVESEKYQIPYSISAKPDKGFSRIINRSIIRRTPRDLQNYKEIKLPY